MAGDGAQDVVHGAAAGMVALQRPEEGVGAAGLGGIARQRAQQQRQGGGDGLLGSAGIGPQLARDLLHRAAA